MSKWCETKPTLFRLRIHSPANPLHAHIDVDQLVIKDKETDWDAWSELIRQTLLALGYGQTPLLTVGFILDLVNGLDEQLRMALVQGIVEGRGFGIEIEEGSDEIGIDLPVKYTPLPQKDKERRTESGLILPSSPTLEAVK